jgi:phage I-like protein
MMTGLSLATCDLALPPGQAPEWVQLFPHDGRITGRDGREWELVDPSGLVLAFQSGGIDLPVDYEHQNENPDAKARGPIPAAGWIKELRAENGVWGRVEWTATASEMIGRREYRFLSPSFLYHAETGQIVRLKGAGLVHNPNLHLTALASQEDAMIPPKRTDTPAKKPATKPDQGQPMDAAAFAAMIAELLGLPPDTPQDQLFAKLQEKIGADPDPAKYVPVAAVQAMLSERNLSLATASQERATQKVDQAVRDGYLSPSMKDWATALCRSNEASFDNFISSAVPQFAHLFKPTHTAARPHGTQRGSEVTELADAICSQLGLKPGALTE